jgi:WD40 repeat protein
MIADLSFSLDGKRLSGTTVNDETKVWGVASGDELDPKAYQANLALVGSNGKLLIKGGGKEILYWDTFAGHEQLARHEMVGVFGRTSTISPDGTLGVIPSNNGTLKVFDLATGRELYVLSGQRSGTMAGAVFSPDRKRIAAVNGTTTVYLWDALTGQPVVP